MIRSTPDRDAEELMAANRRQERGSEQPPVLVMMDVIRRNLVLVAGAVALGLLIGVVWTMLTPRLYTAEAVVRVVPPLQESTGPVEAAPNPAEFRPILLNRQSVATALAKYHLDKQWTIDQFIGRACNLDVVKGTNGASVTVTLPDPQQAAAIANDLVTAGVSLSQKLSGDELSSEQTQYQHVVKILEEDEQAKRNRFLEYKKSAQLEALRAEVFKLIDERVSIVDLTTEIAEKRAELERVTLERNARPELLTAERAVSGALQDAARDASGRSTAGLKMNEQSVNDVRQELDFRVGSLTSEIAGLDKKRSEVIEKYGLTGTPLAKLNKLYEYEVEQRRLEADYEISKKVYEEAVGRFRNLMTTVMQRKADILPVDPAMPPTEPNSRGGLTKLIVSLAAMLSIAAVMIAWREAARYEKT